MAKKRDTKNRILAAAEELLLSRGFQGFSYHHISERLGIRNAAVHYYFPTKNDLGLALVERNRDFFRWWAEQLQEQSLRPACCVDRLFLLYRRNLESSRVCPLGVIGVELPGVSEAMHTAAQTLLDEVTSWLAGVLERGRQEAVFSFHGDPRVRALAIVAMLQGCLQVARLRDVDIFEQVTLQIRSELGRRATVVPVRRTSRSSS